MKLIADKSFLLYQNKMVKRDEPFDSKSDEDGKNLIKDKLAHAVSENKSVKTYETKIIVPEVQEVKIEVPIVIEETKIFESKVKKEIIEPVTEKFIGKKVIKRTNKKKNC